MGGIYASMDSFNESYPGSKFPGYPLITANEISSKIGITERAVRKIIVDFDKEGYIVKGKEGRGVRYKINSRMPLRRKTQGDKAVADLLKALG
jgi:DNA-binding transcriptional regulator PaaX